MSKSRSPAALRVAVVGHEATRLGVLRTTLSQDGYEIVAPDEADVIVGNDEAPLDKPMLVIGGRERNQAGDHAGWLPADASAEQIDAALRAIAVGLQVRPADVPPDGFEMLHERSSRGLLTPRELDVLNAISAGHSNKTIARELGISLHTVKFHVESIFRKLGARTRAEAVVRAMERRISETVEL